MTATDGNGYDVSAKFAGLVCSAHLSGSLLQMHSLSGQLSAKVTLSDVSLKSEAVMPGPILIRQTSS